MAWSDATYHGDPDRCFCGDWNDSKHECPATFCKCEDHSLCPPDCQCYTQFAMRWRP